MAALAKKEKVLNRIHTNWKTNANEDLIDDLIGQVTSQAESFTGRRLLLGSYTDTLSGDGRKLISVAAAPVWTVSKVEIDEAEVSGYQANLDTGIFQMYRWPSGVGNIKITYTAGWDLDTEGKEPPADLEGAIVDEVVARFYVYRSQPRVGEGLVDLTTTFFQDSVEKTLKAWRLHRI